MPYRAMIYTLFAVLLALLTVGMWLRAVKPSLNRSQAAELIAPPTGEAWKEIEAAHDAAGLLGHPDRALGRLLRGVSLLSLLLICLLFVVGFFATFREWVKVSAISRPARRRQRTKYVDAWKIAGERADAKGLEEPPPEPHQGTA
jgi:hypothetical protein